MSELIPAIERIEALADATGAHLRQLRGEGRRAQLKGVRLLLVECFNVLEEARNVAEQPDKTEEDVARCANQLRLLERRLDAQALELGLGPTVLGYFEMVGLRIHEAFSLRAYRPRRDIGEHATEAERQCDVRAARIEAFLAVLGVKELPIGDAHKEGYTRSLLETDRLLIRRKKPKK